MARKLRNVHFRKRTSLPMKWNWSSLARIRNCFQKLSLCRWVVFMRAEMHRLLLEDDNACPQLKRMLDIAGMRLELRLSLKVHYVCSIDIFRVPLVGMNQRITSFGKTKLNHF